MIELYKNIKARRLDLGLSQQELATRTGYTDRSSIAKIEAGKIDLPQSKIRTFAAALETTISDLMGQVKESPSDIYSLAVRLNDKGVRELTAYAEYLLTRPEYLK